MAGTHLTVAGVRPRTHIPHSRLHGMVVQPVSGPKDDDGPVACLFLFLYRPGHQLVRCKYEVCSCTSVFLSSAFPVSDGLFMEHGVGCACLGSTMILPMNINMALGRGNDDLRAS